jgi:hypothetical protein
MVVSVWADQSRKAELQPQETSVIARLQAEGFIEQGFQRADLGGGFTLVEAASDVEALARLHELPFVANGVLSIEVYPVNPRPHVARA